MHNESRGASGWDVLDDHLDAVFGGCDPLWYEEPRHAPDRAPLMGFGIYKLQQPAPHWFIVTYGFTDLGAHPTRGRATSGWGFELTMRLARQPEDDSLPRWAFYLLGHLARYVHATGNGFAAEDEYTFGGRLPGSSLEAALFVNDPELPTLSSPEGRASFLQVVPITGDELEAARSWSAGALLELLGERLPLYITDLARASALNDGPRTTSARALTPRGITAAHPRGPVWLDRTPITTH